MSATPPNAGRLLPGYEEFRDAVLKASYHRADDSGKEWGAAGDSISTAAQIALSHDWRFWQLEQAMKAAAPLVTIDEIVDRQIAILRKKEPTT